MAYLWPIYGLSIAPMGHNGVSMGDLWGSYGAAVGPYRGSTPRRSPACGP
ncbi:hypothetical protein CP082626L3_1316, partial [Chlamydia psittaci 08-2626_L3]